jgi:hypothetical protein
MAGVGYLDKPQKEAQRIDVPRIDARIIVNPAMVRKTWPRVRRVLAAIS